ncbi:uncharacterized protein isoform X4 [Leptinotarsa decemlineata]|uniref:uncharacterized protein isoform X4 n=1 Tax=Leptinotarsa decemlineata TaxID=7539 RepID=UPI003D306DE1
MSQLMKKRFPSITSIDVQSDGNTSFLRAARNGQLDKVLEHLKSNIDINTSNANGLNALHLASKDGHVEIVEELLKRGAVVDAATKKGNTALHIASLAGQEEVVKLLVQHGASVNVQSQNGFTPLYMAAQENHDNVVKYLLSNGANQSLSTEDGFTPLAVAMQQGHDKVVTVLLENDTRGKIRLPALHIAAKKDDVKAAKLLLENEHNPDVTSKSGFTPLHIASHYGNQQIANLLIQKGADVNYSAKHNITPLHVASKWGKANMVALLLEHGATIEAKTRDGLTPLHCAARSGHEQVVDMLLERGAPISSKTKNGLAPLHMAAQGDHVDAARILLYHRAPVDEVTVDYLTALHVAAHCGHVRVAKLLLDRQADANARALNGFTPLHIACKKNRIKVVELLLKHGASIGATTESGLTPLHVASFMGCMNIVIYLLQHDANPDVPTVRGETPLHLAARANQTDIIRILLRNGAQVDARAREQQTPLHIASRLGNVDIVMLLLQHGAKVDNATKDMYTALHIASKEGQDEVAAVLLDNGASLDATTKKGFTPLHLAAKYGHLKVAKLLLQKEAPVDAQGKNGVTPLHVASHYDHQSVALLLLDKGASPHATAKNGHTPLHIAARKNQMDIANTLLEYGAQPNAESKAGFTPLHLSSQEGHGEMSALLVEHKADPNHEAKNGLTPLHLCAQEDRVPVAEVLVKNGAEVNAATKGGYTPLHIASHYGQTNMVKFLLQNGANVESTTSLNYTPLHQAAQQGHANIVNILLENNADPNAVTTSGQTPLNIAQKLGYITVIETLKVVTTVTTITTTTTTNIEEKYKVQAPELMHETFMSDSEEEGGEDTVLGDQTYRYLTADEMKSLGDDSLPIDVTRDERIDSNRMVSSGDSNILPPQHIEDSISPEHVTQNYVEYIKKYSSDNIDIARHPINIGKLHWKNFLVSFLVDARGGAMRGCRHSGVRVIVPPRCAPSPTRITCRYVRPQRTPHPPPLMEGEALASRVLELGPVGAKFLGPVIIEVPHFAALRGKEREIVILRSDNGESWKEHTVESSEEILNEVLHDSFEAEDLNQLEDVSSGRITRILTQDFPQYFAVVSRVRQEVHAIGPEGGMVSSTVVPQVQAVFPEGALTKKIKVGLQAQPIDPELTAKLLGHSVAVSPVVTVEPRRRKFHKAITLSMPAPRAHSQGMINQYSGSAPTLRLLCSITGGTTRAQWEDVTGSTPLTFVNDCVSFTTTVSARFWLMDCRNIGDATKMATELYKEAIHVPFMAKFVVFAKRVDPLEARLRVFCMTDDKEDKTLEHQEHFTEVAKSRDVEVLEGKQQYVEFAGNLVPITKSGEQLSFSFRAFRENRLPYSVRVKDQHAEAVSRCLFMKEPKVPKGEPPQQPICILNIVLPDDIVTDTISLTDTDSLRKYTFLSENFDYYRPDPRLADMSNLLGEDWVPLANQLGLTTSEINVIKSEYPDSVAKQAQSMLRMWLSQSGNKSQTNTLENALRRIGREDIIPQCLNVDHAGPTITRIKHEEIGTYRLKKDIDSIDNDAVSDEVGQRVRADRQEAKVKLEFFDKYSAEEKEIEKSEEEDEETFDKPVAERREQIQKRLSAERTIPASSQRREIVQEITTIKEQNLVEDKIAEVQQKVKTTDEQTKTITTKTVSIDDKTVTPETKTVSRTIEIKTTIPSDSKVLETVSHKESQEPKSTTVKETRTFISEISHKTAGDSELLEGVTQSFDKKKIMPKLIADEDPKSPKFSKTPPPSPADFILRERAATVQEWEAPRQQLDLEPEAPPLEKDATQKGKTTVFHTEEKPFYQNITDRSFVNPKPIYDLTNALIQSESRAEPYHCHTEKHYKINKYADEKQESQSALSKDKKRKKSILGTIKTFVGKSFESDSDSEKSLKKEKKKEKKKIKVPLDEVPPEIPIRPTRKPKLPTPTEDRKYADIPFFESSPTDILEYRSTESDNVEQISVSPPQLTYVSSITIPIADLDDSASGKPRNLREQAEHIVTDVISNGEKAVKENLAEKIATKPKKQKVVIVNEQVTKTFSPMSVEEEEFTITIDPTKKETPKKTRETFTLNIDESIGKIEKEILGKSPILPEENLVKPIAQFSDKPLRSPIFDNLLNQETSQPQISLQPDQFVSQREKWQTCPDLKTITNNLIQNEITFSGWADDKYNLFNTSKIEYGRTKIEESEEKLEDEQKEKIRKKHGKLFSIFSTTTRNESDNISRKKELDKQYSETMKEGPIDPQIVDSASEIKPTKDIPKTPKLKKSKSREKEEKGFLGLLKKGKPGMRPAFSETAIKNMIDSTAFLKEEINKYHDVKMTSDISENYDAMLIYGKEKKTKNYDTLGNGLGHHDIQFIVKEENVNDQKHESEDENDVSRKTVQSTERDQERSDFEHFPSVEESKSVPPQKLKNTEAKNVIALGQSEEKSLGENDKQITTESMKKCDSFLEEEVARFHDVRPIVTKAPPLIQEKLTTIIVSETETPKKTKGKHGDEKKGTFFDIFRKKGSVEKDVKLKSFDAESLLPSAITETLKKDSDVFLKNEVEKYHDVRPIVTNERTIIQSEIPSKAESKLVSPQKLEDIDTKKVIALDQSKKKSLGENEKQKSIESSKEHTGPRSVQISNKDCDSFLKEEIARFHDVRPIVIQQPTLIQEKLTTTIVSETKSPKKSKGKHSDEKKGTFFDIFRKKGSEEKDVKLKSSEAESPLPSAITETLKKDSDVFLKNEVEKYHDVRPIVTNERTIIQSEIPSKAESKLVSPQKLEGTETKNVIALDQSKKKSLGENEKQKSIESSKEHIGPGSVQISNKDCDSFLKEEVARFHDVRPIVTKESTLIQEKLTTTIVSETKSPKKSKGKHSDEKKGTFFDIFRKKGSEEKDVKLKSSEAESLLPSAITETLKKDSDVFLKNEVEKYHDVRPIVTNERTIIQSEIPSKAESKLVSPQKLEGTETKKVIALDQSKKKSLGENEKQKSIESSKEHIGPGSVQISNKDCDSFLKEEVARFHDVRPIVIQQPTIIQEKLTTTIVSETKSPKKSKGKHSDEKKGTFFDIFRKKGSEEKDVKLKSSEAESPLPSAITETLKKDSDVFLKNEVEKYHDVRPIVTNERTIIQSEIPSKAESKLVSPQKLEGTETKKVIALDQSKKKSLGENEKQKSIESSKEHIGPGSVQISNKDCDSFLKEEVARFHDVRPIVIQQPTIIQEKLTTTIVSETKSPKKSKGKHSDEKKGTFFDIFRKKGSEEKDVKLKSSEAESPLPSAITETLKKDSDVFLKNEVEKYHDVRPIVTNERTIIQSEIPSKAESKLVSPQKLEGTETKKVIALDQSKKKSLGENAKQESIESSKEHTGPGSVEISNKDCDSFLKEEIARFHDVRPIVTKEPTLIQEKLTTTIVSETKSPKKSKGKHSDEKKGTFFDIFRKKGSEEKDVKLKSSEAESLLPSAITETLKKDSDVFLKNEFEKYHDVRPIVTNERTIIQSEIPSKAESKLVSPQKLEGTETKKVIALDQSKKKSLGENEKQKSIESSKEHIGPGSVQISNKDCDSFLKEEVARFHDVRPIVTKESTLIQEKLTTTIVSETKSPKKSKGKHSDEKKGTFFDIFRKKGSEEKDVKLKSSEAESLLPSAITETLKKDSDVFLKNEVEKYHDVRPIVTNERTIIQSELTSKAESKLVLSQKLEDTETKKVTALDQSKKKSLGENAKQESIESSKEHTGPGSVQISNKDCDSFLKEEIARFHDVRPIVTKEPTLIQEKLTTTIVSETKSPKKSKGKHSDEKKGTFFDIFRKKGSEEKDVKLKSSEAESLLPSAITETLKKDSDVFLKNEVEKYHDVRPIVTNERTIIQSELTSKAESKLVLSQKLEDTETKKVTALDQSKKKSLGENAKQESIESSKEHTGPGSVQISNKDCDSFLKEEIARFHDVRPIVTKEPTLIQEKLTTTIVSETKSPKKSKGKHSDEKKGTFFDIFRKKGSEEKDVKLKSSEAESLLPSAITETLKKDSDVFLKNEVEKYHDVRPIVTNERTIIQSELTSKAESKLVLSQKLEDTETKKVTALDQSKKKSLGENAKQESIESSKEHTGPGSVQISNKDCDSFLKEEIARFHDVRPIVTKEPTLIQEKLTTTIVSETKSPKKSKGKHSDEKKGTFFDIFRKKGSEEKDVKLKSSEAESLLPSAITETLKKDSDVFLKNEVEKYHDVRPIVTNERTIIQSELTSKAESKLVLSQKLEDTETKKVTALDQSKKKSLGENAKQESIESWEEQTGPGSVQISNKDCDSFLKEEIARFHDVRPIVTKEPTLIQEKLTTTIVSETKSPKKSKGKHSDEKKGTFFDIFRKKGSEEKDVKLKSSEAESLLPSAITETLKKDSDVFLKNEVEKYHDVRPIVTNERTIIQSELTSKAESKLVLSQKLEDTETKKVTALDQSKKKSLGENAKQESIESSKEHTGPGSVQISNKDCDSFLKEEIARFHDVRPIVIQQPTIIQEKLTTTIVSETKSPKKSKGKHSDEKKGTFFDIFRKKGSEEKDVKLKSSEAESLLPSAITETLKKDSDVFLKNEVEKYHDVRPIVTNERTIIQSEIPSKAESKLVSPQKLEGTETKKVIALDQSKKKSLGENEKQKSIESSKEHIGPGSVQISNKDCDSFLKEEVARFHDVRPIVIQQPTIIQEKLTTTIVSETKSPKKSKGKHSDEKKGTFFDIFRKKGSEEKDVKLKSSEAESLLPSAITETLKKDSDVFLKNEVEKYHDVRPIVTNERTIIQSEIPSKAESKLVSPQKLEGTETKKVIALDQSKKKSLGENENLKSIESSKEHIGPGSVQISNKDCDSFLKEEVARFHDVRPIVIQQPTIIQEKLTTTIVSETKSPKKSKGKHSDEKKGTFFDIFRKKGSEEKDVKLKSSEAESLLPSAITETLKKDSDVFLKNEVEKYHDVRPIVTNERTIIQSEIPSKAESKLVSPQKLEGTETKKVIALDQSKKKSLGENEKQKSIESSKEHIGPGSVQISNKDCDSFLKEEVARFHDVRPIVIQQPTIIQEKLTTTIVSETKSPKKSKGKHSDEKKGTFFDIFRKKGSEEKDVKLKSSEAESLLPSAITETLKKDSDVFLKNEVEKYHDVRPIVTNERTIIQSEIPSKAESKLVSPQKLEGTETKKVIALDQSKKKSLGENENLKSIESSKEHIGPGSVQISNKDCDSFLKEEVARFHDVRPIVIQQPTIIQEKLTTTIVSETKSPKKSKGKHSDEKKGTFFDIFRKKGSEEKDVKLKSSEAESLLPSAITETLKKDSDVFLKNEVEKYHDVRPIVTNERTIIQSEIPSKAESKLLSPQKLEDTETKKVIALDQSKKKSLGENVKQTSIESSKEHTGPGCEQISNKEYDSFLKEEVARFHDVRPIVIQQPTIIQEKLTTTIVSETKSPKKSKGKHGDEKKGTFFDIFRKKGSEEKDVKLKSSEAESLLPSAITETLKKDSDVFLKNEVEKYHDVRPIVTNERTIIQSEIPSKAESKLVSPQKLEDTETKKVIVLDQSKKKSLGGNEKQKSIESSKEHTGPRSVQISNKDCDSFLKEEIARFHDVRPIVIQQPTIIQEKLTTTIVSETKSPKKSKGKHSDEKKGTFFDIFRKKGSEEKDVKLKSSEAESLLPSAISETLKKDSDVFLKNEVEIYHDVRPIVTNERTIIQSEIPSKAESKLVSPQKLEDTETKKVIVLDQSKKKSLGENAKQESIESSKEHTGPRSVQISNKDCDSFLKEEIARFHDVRPIVTKEPTLIQEKLTTTIVSETKSPKKSKGKHSDEKKGTFFDIFRKKGSEEKDVKLKSSEAESLLPSAISETLKKDSDVFLKNEVEIYHDVRPIVTNERTIIQSEIPSKAESKLVSPQKLEDTETKKVIALDQSKKKSLGENEKQTSIESSKEHTGPGCEQISNKECDSFLKEEVARFHDVRPIVTKEPTLIQEKLTTTIVSETKFPKKSKGKHGDEKKGTFLDIFRKKGSEEKDVKLKSSEAESLVPSGITVTSMIDSDAFLKNEVEIYHDVRPIIQMEIPSIAESKSVVPRKIEEIGGNKSTPLDQSKEKNSVEKEEHQPIENSIKQTHEIHVCEPDTEEPMKTNIFDERQGEPSRIVTTTVSKETLPEGERIMRVNTEVITGTIQIESETLEDFSKLEEQISIKLNEIRKKLPETSDSVVEELDQEIKHEKNEEKPCSVSMNPKIQLSSSETPKTEVAPVSKERIKITEKHFVKEGGYLNETYEVGVEGVSGIQNQRRERGDNSLHDSENFLNRELDKYEGSYSELVKQKVENVKNKEIQPKLSAAALGNMITSSNFLREEVAKYHDVRPRVSNVESETKAKEKGSKFFGFFSKKKSKDKSGQSEYIESKKEGKKPKKGKSEKKAKDHSLKESDSKDFYEGEIDRCQKGEKIKDDVKEEGGSFFGLFSKKTKPQSEAKNAEKKTIQSMSQALKEIQDSSEFLHMEVTAYHDVRPESKEVQGSTSNPEVDHKSPTVLSDIFQDTADKQIDDKVTTQKTFSDEHFQSEESSPTRVVTTTVTKKSIPKGERVSKVTTEVITGTIQLDPSVLSDLSKLEDEINSKLDKIRAEMSDNTSRETCDDGKESELIHKYHQSFADSTKKTSETHDIIITDGNEQNSQAIGSVFQETHDKKQISEIPHTPLFGKFSDHVSSTDFMKLSLSEEAVKVINTTDDFLMSELKNYEDGNLEPRKDSDSNPKKKSSGIFGMFSKKEKSESPKVTDRKPEKQKSESCADGSRKLGFIEKVGEKIQVFPSSGKKRVFEVTDSHYSEGWDKGMDGTFQDISSNLDVKTTNISTAEPAHYEKGYVQSEGTISETISETKQKVSDAAEHEMEKNTNQENIENRDHVEVKNEPLSFVDDLLHSFDVKIDTTKNEFLDYTNLLNTPSEDTVKSLVSRTEKISTTDSDFLKETKKSTAEEIASFEQTITEKFSNTMKLTEEFTTKSKRILEPMSSVDSERRHSENCEMTENKARKQVFDTHDTISTGKSGGEKRVEHHIKLRVATTIQNVEDSAKIAQDKISKDTSGINKKGKSKKEFPVMGDKGDIVGATRDQRKGAVKKLPAGGKKTSYETEYHRQQMTHIKPSVTDSADISEKSTKKSESSLKKSERKISDKTDDLKKEIESEPLYVEKSIKNIVPTVDDNMEKHESLMKKFEYMTRDSPDVKQKTIDFLESENLGENFKMTRATSDYGGEVRRNNELSTNISEANIDLSNLPRNTDDIPECPTSSYVTSPYSTRRTLSTRFPKGERPEVIEITYDSTLESSSEDSYIVTEPDETVIKTSTRSPLFHMESEEDSSSEVHEITKERQDSVKSNILEILTENKLECLLTDLTENFKETDKPVGTKYTNQEKLLEEHKKESQADVELIERKLRDLDKALDSLEKVNLGIETDIRNDLIKEKKLRRVERKFEKMASEVIEKEAEGGKDVQMTSPEIEEKRETEYRTLVSQLSTEEISDFQKEYNHLWDENTFSKSSDWESKTPDSQIDAQELPQGDIVYMGPVNLNKDKVINKAGIEVDVIPIMRSPCASPKHRKRGKRAKSDMGYYKGDVNTNHLGSLPDLKSSSLKGSLLDTVMQMNPKTFLSSESLPTDNRPTESSDNKGILVTAVMNWLQKSSPFESLENINNRSAESIQDDMDISMSLFDEDDCKSQSNSQHEVPHITISLHDQKSVENAMDTTLGSDEATSGATSKESTASTMKTQVTRRRPLRYEISVEDQTEVDPREHDWRFNLPKHAEGEEGAEKDEAGYESKVADQHQLSEEMKALLKELEKESKQ